MTNTVLERLLRAALTLAACLVLALAPEAAAFNAQALPPGDALVPLNTAFGFSRPGLSKVEGSTGNRVILSDFTNPAQGPTAVGLHGVAIDPLGRIWALSNNFVQTRPGGALFLVDGATGSRQLVSDFGEASQGPTTTNTFRVISNGTTVFVSDTRNIPPGAIYAVDPATGTRTVLSDFGDPAQGPIGRSPINMAFDGAGQIIVTDQRAGPAGRGKIFRVDSITGQRTEIADFAGGGLDPQLPHGLAIEASGHLLVTTTQGAPSRLLRIDPATGTKTEISRFDDPAQGPTSLGAVRSIAIEEDGTVLAADQTTGGHGVIFRINLVDGTRTILSDFGDPTQGHTSTPASGSQPFDIVIVPVAANTAPAAGDDAYSTAEDTTLSVPAPGVLENDTDADGNPLTASLVSGPAHGTLTLNADGSFIYTPNATFNGTDTFTYSASDGAADSAPATVTLTVTAVPDVPGAMIGAGHVTTGGHVHAFAFAVAERGDGREGGTLVYAVRPQGPHHGNGRRQWFVATGITAVAFSDTPGVTPARTRGPLADTVVFTGTGRWNDQPGYTFEARAVDAGEPGRGRDEFAITILDPGGAEVAAVSGRLGDGNIESLRIRP